MPTLGFVVEDDHSAVVIPSDTGPTEEIWHAANRLSHLKAVFLEVSFPNHLQWLADASGHLTPQTVVAELEKLDRRGARIYLYHLKPSVIGEVKKEIAALGRDYLQICELDDVYNF